MITNKRVIIYKYINITTNAEPPLTFYFQKDLAPHV